MGTIMFQNLENRHTTYNKVFSSSPGSILKLENLTDLLLLIHIAWISFRQSVQGDELIYHYEYGGILSPLIGSRRICRHTKAAKRLK